MNLQNIILNFEDETIKSMFEDKHYDIDITFDFELMKSFLTQGVKLLVVQISEDQHLSEKRIVLLLENGNEIMNFSEIQNNKVDLYNKINELELSCIEQLQEKN
jgi:hypothetical protein